MGNDGSDQGEQKHDVYFNPRSRVGNDNNSHMIEVFGVKFQSTFPRGERLNSSHSTRLGVNFNPRSRVGNDTLGTLTVTFAADFNPRSRVGNDLKRLKMPESLQYFNPRSRVGNDDMAYADYDFYTISIHVPAWGTTVMRTPFR